MSRVSVRAVVMALGATLLAVGPPPVVAQDAIADPGGAFLQAGDLPDGFTTSGIHPGSDLDLDQAAFESAGGQTAATGIWTGPSVTGVEPVVQVMDIRLLFPGRDDAAAYLDAAGATLEQSTSGLTPASDAPTVGDASVTTTGHQSVGDQVVDVVDIVFQTGPMIGRVRISGYGTTVADAQAIGTQAGARVAAWLAGSADAGGSPPPAGSVVHEWATGADASSAYGTTGWSATAATGAPDVPSYADDQRAWAPASADGTTDWLELDYPWAVVPSSVGIVESWGNGAVIGVEFHDAATDTWVSVWSGTDPTAAELATFRPPITPVDFATDRIRLTLGDVVPGWSEIDAVELVGTIP